MRAYHYQHHHQHHQMPLHSLAPTNIALANMLSKTETYNITAQCIRSRPNISQGIHSPTNTQSKSNILLQIYRAKPHSPTYNQSKATFSYIQSEQSNILLHTSRARHTFNLKHSSMDVRVEASNIPQTFSHNTCPTSMLPQTYRPRHTIAREHLLPKILVKAHIQLRRRSRKHLVALHDPFPRPPVPKEEWSSKDVRAPTPQHHHLP